MNRFERKTEVKPMRAQPRASHHIGGSYHEDADGRVFESHYPATGEVIARLHAASSPPGDMATA